MGKRRIGQHKIGIGNFAKRVDSTPAIDRIGAFPPGEIVVAGTSLENIATAEADEFHPTEREGTRIEPIGRISADEQGARKAGERGLGDTPGSTNQKQTVGEQHVGIASLHDRIGAAAAHERISARTAAENIVAGVARDRVIEFRPGHVFKAADRGESAGCPQGEIDGDAAGVRGVVEQVIARRGDQTLESAEQNLAG